MQFTQLILLQSFKDEFVLSERNTEGTPAATGTNMHTYEDEPMLLDAEQTRFRKAVGKLWFLARLSRHDLLHAVRDASKFSQGAWSATLKGVKRIMKYCTETPDRGLKFAPAQRFTNRDDFEFVVAGYADSNWAADRDNSHSVMSTQVYMEGCCVAACSKQMRFTVLSVA
jgi:hypothetical protein